MAVNEADHTSVIVQTVRPEKRQQRCEVGVVVRRCSSSAHTGNEVSSCMKSCVVFVGLLVGFQWPANTLLRMWSLPEVQDGVVVGMVWPLPSGLASSPLTEHFRLNSHTPVI